MTSDEYRKLSILLSGIKNGARDAFADIFEMYENKVYFLCCKLLKSKSEAKKMTIEIFDLAYIQLPNIPNAATFEKWLYKTVFSQCRHFLIDNCPEVFDDYTDSDSSEGEKADILLAQDYDDMLNYPDGIDISVDMMQTADSILSEMPQKLRNTAILHYFCGFEEQEIAQTEQISLSAYKNRLYKARIRLKTEEHKYCGMDYDVEGMVTFFADVLSTMSDSIVIPPDIASGVTARTGVNCIKNINNSNDISNQDTAPLPRTVETKRNNNYKPSQYATMSPPVPQQKQGMSPAVKVLMAIVAILFIIGGTVAAVLAIQRHTAKNDTETTTDSVSTTVETTEEITTQEITTEEITTEEETTTEESTTEAETTTEEATTVTTTEATTASATETTTEETTATEPDGGENDDVVYIEPLE